MKALFLTLYPDAAASPRYRVRQFIPYLESHGVTCCVASAVTPQQFLNHSGPTRKGRAFWYHFHETPQRLRQILTAKSFDLVFVQKAVMSAYVLGTAELLRHCTKCLVYDIDDAVHLQSPHSLHGIWSVLEDRNQIRKLFRVANRVFAGNQWLVDAARQSGARAEFMPTVVDTDRFVPLLERNAAPYTIGWIGNMSTMKCLEPAVNAVSTLHNATIHLIGAEPAQSPWPNARIIPWKYDTEVEELQRFSAGIMPLLKNEWMRGKCALKALQYMACGIPCIATPFGAILDIIRHNENGLFADSTAEWTAALEQLRAPDERCRIGEAGRAFVENHFSLKKAAPRMRKLLESALCR